MAKRDFVDHCDFVDPVGEGDQNVTPFYWTHGHIWSFVSCDVVMLKVYMSLLYVLDGVVLIDPAQMKGKKGW